MPEPKRAHHDGFQVGRVDDMTDEVFADAREEREDDHIVVEPEMGRHRLGIVGLEDALTMVGDVHAGIDEVGIVERLEGVELLGALLRGAVAPQQMTAEEDAHLRHHRMAFSSLAAAISTAVIRFSLPSVRSWPIGSWLPVKMTGFVRFSSM